MLLLLLLCRRVISFLFLEPSVWEMVGSGQDVFEEHGLESIWMKVHHEVQEELLRMKTFLVVSWGRDGLSWKEVASQLLKAFFISKWPSVLFRVIAFYLSLEGKCLRTSCRSSSPNPWSSALGWLWACHPARAEPSGAVWALLDTENGEKERVAVQKAAIGRK